MTCLRCHCGKLCSTQSIGQRKCKYRRIQISDNQTGIWTLCWNTLLYPTHPKQLNLTYPMYSPFLSNRIYMLHGTWDKGESECWLCTAFTWPGKNIEQRCNIVVFVSIQDSSVMSSVCFFGIKWYPNSYNALVYIVSVLIITMKTDENFFVLSLWLNASRVTSILDCPLVMFS